MTSTATNAAAARLERRRSLVPPPRYPEGLPIVDRREDVLAAIRDHQVVIVAGETGSGKSTQIPKLCLELGRGIDGMIGHTQPRRIAARAVAERVAEELETPLGGVVGYTVRFTDRVSENTLIKVMTDGILLAEIQRDRLLRRYDTLIIDEAHERSLNVDFILGFLKQLLPKRPDLKVIVTSATIDTERFSQHFDDAPIIEVSGRMFPVEVRYRPLDEAPPSLEDDDLEDDETETTPSVVPTRPGPTKPSADTDRDQAQAICDAVEELCREGPGDILVFLSGEREIRDTADALAALELRDVDLLPLFARLSAAEQHRVFQPHRGRRIVLATNVAETSLTVPGIRYVVDPGRARISRYNRRTKVQRLPIEAVSQASANQRAGRCGRVAPGICIRLYSEDDFAARDEFTDPEILRTNLASVILQMVSIGLGDIAAFPFVDPPDARSIKDGIALLEELGALDPDHAGTKQWLTPVGRQLARIPVDPRLGRMMLAADRFGCLREVTIIAAALSIQDPRERPTDKEQAAAEKHARFVDGDSDFLAYLRLWEYLQDEREERSSNQFRKLCRADFLNYLRVREWQDLVGQLRRVTTDLKLRPNTEPADANRVHMALLAGLVSHIGMHDPAKREYRGARNARFAIARGSALSKKTPRWVMAAELVETNRLWARVNARIQPEWVERVAPHLVKRTYSEPWWDPDRVAPMVNERLTLYGLTIVSARRVNYGRVDAAGARQMFVQHALVEGEWDNDHDFFAHNRELVERARELEERTRRHNRAVDDDALYDFYAARIPESVSSAREFDAWWKTARRETPGLLTLPDEVLSGFGEEARSPDAFPDVWQQGDLTLPVSYAIEPGTDTDGAMVHIPIAVLNQLRPEGFDWHVPGLRAELITELLHALPKPLRRHVVPVPDHAREVLERFEAVGAGPDDGPLLEVLAGELSDMTGEAIRARDFQLDKLPSHLRITFRVEDDKGRIRGEGKDLAAIIKALKREIRVAIADATPSIEQAGLTSWSLGTIPQVVEVTRGGHPVKGYPALVDEGETAALRVMTTEDEQAAAHVGGTRRLLLLNLPSPVSALSRLLPKATTFALAQYTQGSVRQLLDDAIAAAVDALMARHGGAVWDATAFEELRAAVHDDQVDATLAVLESVAKVLPAARAIEERLATMTAPVYDDAAVDIRAQLARLTGKGFVVRAGARRLPDIVRYVVAIDRRLDRLGGAPQRDADLQRGIARLESEYAALRAKYPRAVPAEVEAIAWMLEELRVSYWAQSLGTPSPVSEKRILREIYRLQNS